MVQDFKLVLGCDRKDFRIRQEGDLRAGFLRLTDDIQLLGRLSLLEFDVVNLAVPINLRLEPDGQRVHALGTHTVQTAGVLVRPLAKLTARVQVCEHQLHRRHFELLVRVHRDAAAVVLHRHRSVHMNGDLDLITEPGQVLVDRVVEHLVNTVMESVFVRVTDVHPRPLPYGLQTL